MPLVARNVSRRYGAVQALRDVSATFSEGEIHAVLGENGAGKSTLMGVLSGFVVPDAGQIELNGQPIAAGKPFQCRRMGIEMVHQHFTLVPEFTVAENLALARAEKGARRLDIEALAGPALKLAGDLGWILDPKAKARSLPVGAQQRVEILKALSGDGGVLIFDEPTAVLSPDEVEDLFRVLRELKAQGKIVILIAHKLSEVMAIADRVTVLRKGVFVAAAPIGEVSERQLGEWMVGEMPSLGTASGEAGDGPSFGVSHLTVLGDRGEVAVRDVSFEVAFGEVLGIGGVDGNGQVELAEALAEIRKRQPGSSTHFETPAGFDEDRHELNIAYIPQDRQTDGLALEMSVADNLLIGGLNREDLTRGAFLRRDAIAKWVEGLIARFSIKVDSPQTRVGSLSGGNQQKVVVSRSLDSTPDLLVAVNPTRGLDIQATAFVHEKIREVQEVGAAVILISTDLDELAVLANRTLFISRGQLTAAQGATAVVGGSE